MKPRYLKKHPLYKSVYITKNKDTLYYWVVITLPIKNKKDKTIRIINKHFLNDREAAIFADKVFIENGKDPVNILKKL